MGDTTTRVNPAADMQAAGQPAAPKLRALPDANANPPHRGVRGHDVQVRAAVWVWDLGSSAGRVGSPRPGFKPWEPGPDVLRRSPCICPTRR